MTDHFFKTTEGERPSNEALYQKQLAMLRTLLEHGAITKEQYEKSSHDLTLKTGHGQQE